MKIINTPINNLKVVELSSFFDERGSFSRLYCQKELSSILTTSVVGSDNFNIKQVNSSLTKKKGSIRGLHFQHYPCAEVKLVRCIRGRIFDVAVDLRKNSKTFLHWFGIELSAGDGKMVVIPEGFAHGFQTIEDDSEILYCVSEYYSPDDESGIRFDDPIVNINWPLSCTDISEKDNSHRLLTPSYPGINLDE